MYSYRAFGLDVGWRGSRFPRECPTSIFLALVFRSLQNYMELAKSNLETSIQTSKWPAGVASQGIQVAIRLILLTMLIVAAGWTWVFNWPVVNSPNVFLSPPSPQTSQPNIILINLDDADRELIEIDFIRMPQVRYFPHISRLAEDGIRFTNLHCNNPLCGPSRASLFTGQYSYKNGVKCNQPATENSRGTTGGFPAFRDFGPYESTSSKYFQNELGVWLKQAGYRTMLVGKYLHDGYLPGPGQTWNDLRAPGWDDAYIALGASYYNTTIIKNGEVTNVNRAPVEQYPEAYRTVVEGVDARDLVTQHVVTQPQQPFFLYLAPVAPHTEPTDERDLLEVQPGKGMAEPRYKSWWPNIKQIRTADYNEWNILDKPQPIRQMPKLFTIGNDPNINEDLRNDVEFRRRVLAMRSVDDMVGQLRQTIEQLGLVGETIILLTSDNGFHLGQQRHFGKSLPYQSSTNVPLIAWGPTLIQKKAVPQGHLLSTIDIAPTVLELAGRTIPEPVQGKSFVPLLRQSVPIPELSWRPEGVLVESYASQRARGYVQQATFNSLRLHDTIYTEWANGEREYYDLKVDPNELINQYNSLNEADKIWFENRLSFLKSEMPTPNSHIETPLLDSDVFFDAVELKGQAEFSIGVNQVRLTITDLTTNPIKYWNGHGWQEQQAIVQANLDNRGGVISNWRYSFQPSLESEGRFRISSRAFAADGNYERTVPSRTFVIDTVEPFCQFLYPQNQETLVYRAGRPMVISGVAQDHTVGIQNVRLTIADRTRNLFWNGTQWQTTHAFVQPTLRRMDDSQRVEWTYAFGPPESTGNVQVLQRAINRDQEFDPTPRSIRFSWRD